MTDQIPQTEAPLPQGVRMLIERMETHPEEFRLHGKFHEIFRAARNVVDGSTHNLLSLRAAQAIVAAEQKFLDAELTSHVVAVIAGGARSQFDPSLGLDVATQQMKQYQRFYFDELKDQYTRSVYAPNNIPKNAAIAAKDILK